MKAIFFNIPASGHVNPSLPLTAELVRRGEEIIYYNTENFRRRIEATGAEFRPYPLLTDEYMNRPGFDGSSPPHTAAVMIDATRQLLPGLLDATRAENPDYVLYDSMCPWGVLTARALGLPSITSLSLLVFNMNTMLRQASLGTLLPMLIRGTPDMMRFRRTSQAIGREYGIPALSFPEFFNAPGDLMVSYTIPEIQPEADKLDARIKFVGPSIAPRGDAGDFPLERLDGQAVIYISLGTIINTNRDFYRACIDAFRDSAYIVVMSVGDKVDPAEFEPLPANFIVRRYNPQLEILQRCALFITHAGMNSVHEGLYYGVPLLLVPQQAEQGFVAYRIGELGAGLKLDTPTPDAIRRNAEQLLNDAGYRRNAEKLSAALRSAGGASRAADLVLEAVVRRRSRTL